MRLKLAANSQPFIASRPPSPPLLLHRLPRVPSREPGIRGILPGYQSRAGRPMGDRRNRRSYLPPALAEERTERGKRRQGFGTLHGSLAKGGWLGGGMKYGGRRGGGREMGSWFVL